MSAKSVTDFFAKKKKVVVKKVEKKEEKWVEPVVEDDSPKGKVPQAIKEEEEKSSRTWSAAPKQPQTGGKGAGSYQLPQHSPGALNDRKFPTMAAGGLGGGPKPPLAGGKKINLATNAYAQLEIGEDSDEEEERMAKPALVSKEKGAKQIAAPKVKETEQELTSLQQREKEEKEKRMVEKEELKRKAREEAKKSMEEATKEAKNKSKAVKVNPNFVQCDTSKFRYGNFNPDACSEKYTTREKVVQVPDSTVSA